MEVGPYGSLRDTEEGVSFVEVGLRGVVTGNGYRGLLPKDPETRFAITFVKIC